MVTFSEYRTSKKKKKTPAISDGKSLLSFCWLVHGSIKFFVIGFKALESGVVEDTKEF